MAQEIAPGAVEEHIAAGDRGGHGIGAGLDAVGQHVVLGAMKLGHTLNAQGRGADALDFRTHLDETFGDVDDFRLACRVLDQRLATGEHCSHHCVMRGTDRDFGQRNMRADETLRRLGEDIAGLELDLGAQGFERAQMQVHRPRADGAAAGQRHFRFAAPREQRRQHPEARAHARDHLVRRGGVDDLGGA